MFSAMREMFLELTYRRSYSTYKAKMLFLLVILWTRFGLLLCEAVITCDAPTAVEGHPGIITCHFHEDVSQTERNILLYQHFNHSGIIDREMVMDCNWIPDFRCRYHKTGYQLGQFGKRTTIEIERASKQMEGEYSCDVVHSTKDSNLVAKPCYFALKDNYEKPKIHNCIQESKDDTCSMNGKVTAIIVLCSIIIVTIFTLVILFYFRKQLKDNLQRCCTRCRSPQEGEGDLEGAVMLPGDESKTKENAKEKEKIDLYIRLLTTMKQTGELDEFYKVNNTDEKENNKSDFATGSSSLPDRRYPFNDKTVATGEVGAVRGASASKGKEMLEPSELQEILEWKLPNDPDGLRITIKEWHERELAEINRRKEELDAQTDLYTVRERHKKEIRETKENDRKKGITDPHKDPKRRKRRQDKELIRNLEDNAAVAKLDTIIKRHEEERKRQKEQDKQRVENAKKELMMKEKTWSPPEEDTKTSLLSPVPVNDGGADEDTEM